MFCAGFLFETLVVTVYKRMTKYYTKQTNAQGLHADTLQ